MATIKSYTDIEQSKKLAEILPIKSADMWWAERYAGKVMENGQYIVEENPVYYPSLNKPSNDNYSQDAVKDIPCWSLAALLNYLKSKNKFPEIKELSDGRFKLTTFIWDGKDCIQVSIRDTIVDACYEMILKLHKLTIL